MTTKTWTCWRNPTHTEIEHHETFGWPQCMECGAAPQYFERTEYLDERLNLTLYVLKPEATHLATIVHPRSGIVGLPAGPERTIVYIEGWRNGPMQYGDRDARGLWEAGVEHAASRMVTAYPTVACLSPRSEDLEAIGTYNPTTHHFDVENEEALATWLTTTTTS